MKKTNVILAVAAATTLSVASIFAHADDDVLETQAIAKQFGLISLDDAKAKALVAKPGVVTDAELDDRDFSKGWDYEFEIVDAEAIEWEVNIDAKTGEVHKVQRDWF
jgi:uncharacterized membrane protein YkoI